MASEFHLSQFETVENPFDEELKEAVEEKNNWQKTGSQCISKIEMITGEISGLGLIDVLAIYTALWSVDINVLLSMLDNEAFERLYSNKFLRTFEVDLRNSAKEPAMSILEAIQAFEQQVINILSYCDNLFDNAKVSALNAEGGTISSNKSGSEDS